MIRFASVLAAISLSIAFSSASLAQGKPGDKKTTHGTTVSATMQGHGKLTAAKGHGKVSKTTAKKGHGKMAGAAGHGKTTTPVTKTKGK